MHQWGLPADDRQVIKEMVEPPPSLFTCGEAFSDYQGWVEGRASFGRSRDRMT